MKASRLPRLKASDLIRNYENATPGTPDHRDLADELEIRCREVGAVEGWGLLFTWDQFNGRLRRNKKVRFSDSALPPRRPCRIYRTPEHARDLIGDLRDVIPMEA